MKILLLGAFSKGALENYYLRGLRALGIECSCFDITKDYYSAIGHSIWNKVINKIHADFFFNPINRKLSEFLDGEFYDIILVFKGLTLYTETIGNLRAHTKILCCYNPDHPFKYYSPDSGNRYTLESIRLYDIYFTYSGRISEQLKSEWEVKSYVIPFGYDDSEQGDYHLDAAIYENKWLFIGTWDREREALLSTLKENNLNIYGDESWNNHSGKKNDKIINSYQGKPLYNDEYKAAIQNASGIFNFLRPQNIEEGSHNMRTFEVPGYGGLLISNRTEEQKGFFEEDKEAIYFEGSEELNDKLQFLDGNKTVVEKIKRAARRRSENSGYGYSFRSRQLFDVIRNYL
jgi:spore maturation protein CgeB